MYRLINTCALILTLLLGAARAVTVPAGWASQAQNGVTTLRPNDLKDGEFYTVLVFPEQPLDGKTLQAWTQNATQQGLKSFGKLLLQGKLEFSAPFWTSSHLVEYQGKPLVVVFWALPGSPGTAQLMTLISTPNPEVARRYNDPSSKVLVSLVTTAPEVNTKNSSYHLPGNVKLGGPFQIGTYNCTLPLPSIKSETRYTLNFYANGEWRRLIGGKDTDGNSSSSNTYKYDPKTGKIDIDVLLNLYNSTFDNDTFTVFYRDSANQPVIYGEDDYGLGIHQTTCLYVGQNTLPSPSEVRAKKAAADAEARRFKWVTAPGQGVPLNQIDSILHYGESVYTFTGLQFQEHWTLLLKDGWAYHGLRVTPADLDVPASRRNEPDQWRKWKRSGDKVLELDPKTNGWVEIRGTKVIPAGKNERLAGKFENSSSYSPGGGGMGSFVWFDYLTLNRDGTFDTSNYSIGGTGTVQAANGFSAGVSSYSDKNGCSSASSFSSSNPVSNAAPDVAGGSSSKSNCGSDHLGTYTLDGYTIVRHYQNGKTLRQLFFFWSSKKDHLFIEDSTFSPPLK